MDAPLRILIVEDVAAEAELVARHLTKAGLRFELQRVDTEDAFRTALREAPPHLILSDFTLPQFDGMRALAIAAEHAPGTPFILVSGTIGEERAIEALRKGAIDYVLKTNLARLAPAVERALKEAASRAARRATERMLRDIVETSQDWIWQLDAAKRFTFSSPAVTQILGHPPAELIGQPFDALLHPEDRHLAASLLPERGTVSGVAARWRHRNGEYRWLERNAIALRDRQGRLTGFRGTDRQVTERREQAARLQRLSRMYRMLSSTNSAIVRSRSRSDLLAEACRLAVEHGTYARALVTLVEPGTGMLRAVAWAGVDAGPLRGIGLSAEDEQSMTGRAMRTGTAVVCNDLLNDRQPVLFREQLLADGFRAAVVLPLLIEDTAIGTFTLNATEPDVFDAAELQALRELASNIAFALQYFQKEEALEFLSYFDAGTGLPKRPLFCQRLSRALADAEAAERSATIVVFDVQRLSLVNDTYGRHVGDGLLAQLAERMKRRFEASEPVAHFGGGTFAVAYANSAAPSDSSLILQSKATQLLAEPFLIEGHELRPSIRSGVAHFPLDGGTAETIVQNAEAALKRAKESGEKYVLYGLMSKTHAEGGLALEARLAGALSRGEFHLHYQPKIDLATRRIVGVEALLRWYDAQSGIVPPGSFIPLLESTGRILEVGRWVLEQAARDAQAWTKRGLPALRIAVNVSPLQLRRRDFVDHVVATTRGWSNETLGLDIELTESMLMLDLESSRSKLTRLREAGVQVAIDDFGTGYASLRHLAKLPVDTLKIDRSFTQGITSSPEDRTLVSTIVTLAHAFRMTTVAEGVETVEQLELLKGLGCDQSQGFLHGRPVPGADMERVLAEAARSTPHSPQRRSPA
ncbi:MAG TPA: EAL domain-containing protein [Steroidobacteraceae bacterium]|nr:EAL domain-containing protein [Steroidobacteraceae bacterium]